jgi:hypothetical protein
MDEPLAPASDRHAGPRGLAKEAFGRDQQATARSSVTSCEPSIADCGRAQAVYACLATQRPLTPHDRVVRERGEGQLLRLSSPDAGGLHCRYGVSRAQRIDPEMQGPPRHAARVAPGSTETDSARVERNSV